MAINSLPAGSVEVSNYEILRRPDGRVMLVFERVSRHSPWHRKATVSPHRRQIKIASDGLAMTFLDFHLPPAALPPRLFLAEVPAGGGEPQYGEVDLDIRSLKTEASA